MMTSVEDNRTNITTDYKRRFATVRESIIFGLFGLIVYYAIRIIIRIFTDQGDFDFSRIGKLALSYLSDINSLVINIAIFVGVGLFVRFIAYFAVGKQ